MNLRTLQSTKGTFTYYVSSRGGEGGKPLLTYHCSNKTKTIEIADIGGGGGSKVGKSC